VTHLEKGILKNCAASLAGQRAGFFAGRLPVHVPVVRALSRECHKHGGAKTMTTSSFVSSFISPGDHDGSSAVACFDRLLFPAFPVAAPVDPPCSFLLFLAAFPSFARFFNALVKSSEIFSCFCRDLQGRPALGPGCRPGQASPALPGGPKPPALEGIGRLGVKFSVQFTIK